MRALGNARSLSWWLGAMLWAAGHAVAQSPVAIPPLDSPVVDLTDTLSTQDRQRLEARARELRSNSGAQLQILIVPTTAPEDVADYAQRVFDTQGLGRRGFDDGLLIVVAKNDRRMRIHVGTGLEARIPDATAKRLIDEYLTPKFRRGDFAGGLDDATSVLATLMNGEPLPAPKRGLGLPAALTFIFAIFAALAARLLPRALGRLTRVGTAITAAVLVSSLSHNMIVVWLAAIIGALLVLDFSRKDVSRIKAFATDLASAPEPERGPNAPGRQWNPDELTFDPDDPEVVRRREARERQEREAARNDSDNDSGWGGGWSGGGSSGGGSRGGGASGGW